jgi:hypothetical protein
MGYRDKMASGQGKIPSGLKIIIEIYLKTNLLSNI